MNFYNCVKMQVIFGVLLMFTGASTGVVFLVPGVCRFHNQTCYGALGEALNLELEMNHEDEIILTKDNSNIFKYKKKRIQTNFNQRRWEFIASNTTIKITSTERGDSGRYSLETFDKNGKNKGTNHLQLDIEAPVSSVEVSYNCLLSERTVSCSSEGDQLQFRWTLSENRNTQRLGDGNQTLNLEKENFGNVTCHVQNHVSSGQSTVGIQECPDLTLVLLGTLSVVLIIASIIVCHVYKKKQGRKNTMTGSSQNDEDVVYSKITHIPNNSGKRKARTTLASDENVEYAVVIAREKQVTDEVQYGEVVFSKHGPRAREQTKEQDECMYSRVQHGQ